MTRLHINHLTIQYIRRRKTPFEAEHQCPHNQYFTESPHRYWLCVPSVIALKTRTPDVATSWNGTTIERRRALSCTPKNRSLHSVQLPDFGLKITRNTIISKNCSK
jgi:hypothetical protein